MLRGVEKLGNMWEGVSTGVVLILFSFWHGGGCELSSPIRGVFRETSVDI